MTPLGPRAKKIRVSLLFFLLLLLLLLLLLPKAWWLCCQLRSGANQTKLLRRLQWLQHLLRREIVAMATGGQRPPLPPLRSGTLACPAR